MDDAGLLLTLAAALLASGVVAGVLAGLLGVGGGIVLVPVLFYVFTALNVDESVKMHMAVGTSLMSMIPTSIRSALAHHKKGAVDVALFRRWAPAAIAGALIGIVIAAWVRGPVLMTIFAVFASLAALHMAFGKDSWRIAQQLPGRITQSIMAFAIGCVSVMMGIGGGTFTVPTLTLFNYPIHRAVGSAAAIGVLIVPATFFAAPWGAHLAHKLDRLWLRRAFALFLGITGLKMAASLF